MGFYPLTSPMLGLRLAWAWRVLQSRKPWITSEPSSQRTNFRSVRCSSQTTSSS